MLLLTSNLNRQICLPYCMQMLVIEDLVLQTCTLYWNCCQPPSFVKLLNSCQCHTQLLPIARADSCDCCTESDATDDSNQHLSTCCTSRSSGEASALLAFLLFSGDCILTAFCAWWCWQVSEAAAFPVWEIIHCLWPTVLGSLWDKSLLCLTCIGKYTAAA